MQDHPVPTTPIADSHVAAVDQGPLNGAAGLVRAVVLLSKMNSAAAQARRPSREARQALQARRRAAAQDAIPAIDAVLERCGGRRIGGATVLGTVAIETTAEGICMLKGMPVVEAIIEDQPLLPAACRETAIPRPDR